MYQEELEKMVDKWEPSGGEVVRTIDTYDDTVERIVKYQTNIAGQELYSLYRYFTLGDAPTVHVSVDMYRATADYVIQHLAERL